MEFKIFATEHTQDYLRKNGIDVLPIKKLHEGRPNIPDAIKNNEIHLIINTPAGKESKVDDSYIRTMAIQHRIPYITTMAAARASVDGIEAIKNRAVQLLSLQDYHAQLRRTGGLKAGRLASLCQIDFDQRTTDGPKSQTEFYP